MAIRWHIQHKISVIPKSVNKDRIINNLDVLDWEIPDSDMKILDTLDFQVSLLALLLCGCMLCFDPASGP